MTIRRRRIPAARNLVLDGLSIAPRHVYFPVERTMALADVAAARSAASPRISWSVVWLKAYAAVCLRLPLLRTVYQRWPWPHFVEADDIAGTLIVNRQDGEYERLCWAIFQSPQQQPLSALQNLLHQFQSDPIEKIYRKQVTFSKMPWPLRRLLWWLQLNFSGKKRTRRFGTFTQSTLAGQGANNGFHQTLLTTSLCFAPIDGQGNALATLICDHRVLDGAVAAEALRLLEEELRGPILEELRGLANPR
jgi:hypothetical protein